MNVIENKFYLGKLCLRGHDHESTGQSRRYVKSCACVTCTKEQKRKRAELRRQQGLRPESSEWASNNPEKHKQYHRKYYATNAAFRERVQQAVKKWREENREHYLASERERARKRRKLKKEVKAA